MAAIAIVATLDTKGAEAAFLAETVRRLGGEPLLIDSGVGSAPAAAPDIPREEAFRLAGVEDPAAFLRENGKAAAQDSMREGLKRLLLRLQGSGRISGVLSVGGAQGTAISAAAMRALPVGFPKVMISTVACGTARFGDYVGHRDILMLPSIVDICGVNSVTRRIFTEGCAAVCGMARAWEAEQKEAAAEAASRRPTAALTMAGITTPCVMRVKEQLEAAGWEVIVCHCNESGSVLVDELARQGRIQAVADITPHEWSGYLFHGLMSCTEHRLEHVYRSNIPLISMPGGSDVILRGPEAELSDEERARVHYSHTPFHTHVRMTREEMAQLGRLIAGRHNEHQGRSVIIAPRRGFSMQNREGGIFYDSDSNAGFAEGVREVIKAPAELLEPDCHINDPACADLIVRTLLEMAGRA